MSKSNFISLKLITGLFSLNPSNMRFPYFKRIVVVFLMIPIFTFQFIVNNFFLLIDNLFFYKFKKIDIKEPLFIVSMPRTGTTMLLHLLSSFKNNFTSFKLWELLFAPSITQKFIFLAINELDKKMNLKIKKTAIYFSNKVYKNISAIHNTGLEQPEEDELILIWSLSSGYIQYFYPDSKLFDSFLDFDNQVHGKKKKKIMKRYFRLIQRHNYVFNRNLKKKFLSKNPFMMSKIDSLHNQFQDAKILSINRCPNIIINSTINLNELIFKSISSVNFKPELKIKTKNLIIKWYLESHKKFNNNKNIDHIYLDFDKIIRKDKKEFMRLFSFLNLNDNNFLNKITNENLIKFKSNHHKNYQIKKHIDVNEIPFMKKYYEETI
jgi:hypothetical protein